MVLDLKLVFIKENDVNNTKFFVYQHIHDLKQSNFALPDLLRRYISKINYLSIPGFK